MLFTKVKYGRGNWIEYFFIEFKKVYYKSDPEFNRETDYFCIYNFFNNISDKNINFYYIHILNYI